MHIVLFDRVDRLGNNIVVYIAQLVFAHKNRYIIKFRDNTRENYKYYDTIFVSLIFKYIDLYNETLRQEGVIDDGELYKFKDPSDFISIVSVVVQNIESDLFSYFQKYIYPDVTADLNVIAHNFTDQITFDMNKTILVHLRLDDVSDLADYDGSLCSNYYKNKMAYKERCFMEYYGIVCDEWANCQAPFCKEKITRIINNAQEKYPDHRVILLTSPNSDTSFLDYDVIKNTDPSLDLFLLASCSVAVFSRSLFALSSLFLNDINTKKQLYIPLWGHFVCCGLDTIYDKIDKSKITYFH
jgi:hypothetical protein